MTNPFIQRIVCGQVIALALLAGCATEQKSPVAESPRSGLQPGDDIIPWNPIHVAGPNAGTNACPVCTYEARPAVEIFGPDSENIRSLTTHLQALVAQEKPHELKGFVIVLDRTPDQLKQIANDLHITGIGLCYPDPQTREHDLSEYKIKPAAMNTIVVYKNYKVTANFVDLPVTDFGKLDAAVRATVAK